MADDTPLVMSYIGFKQAPIVAATVDDDGLMPADAFGEYAGEPPTDPTEDPTTVDGTATVVTVTGIASSIDSGTVTALRCRYAWVDDGAELVPIVLLPGFAGADTEFSDAKIQRIAKYQHPVTHRRYLPIAVTMRGRLTPTTPDAGGVDCVRDSTDIADILDHVVGLVGADKVFGSGKSCIPAGFSTGAHDALLFARRYPDRTLAIIAQWPNFDFLDATDGYYAIVGEDVRTNYLDVWLGNLRTRSNASTDYVVNHYRACDPISGLGEFLALENAPPVWIVADAEDPAVPLPDHQRLIQACQTLRRGSATTHVHVSEDGDTHRFRHNEAHASAGNIWSERFWAMPLLGPDLAEWRFPRAGKLRVLGYLETRADTDRPGFKAWLGSATAPRASNVGGQGFVADLTYDDSAAEYRFSPVTTQSGYAQIIRGADNRSKALTAGTPLTIDLNEAPAFASMTAAGMAHDFNADISGSLTMGGSDVTAWADQIGALSFTASGEGPAVATDGDGADYLSFVAASSNKLLMSQLAFTPDDDFTLALVVYTGAASAFFFAESHHGSLAELRVRRNTTLAADYLLDAAGTYGTVSSNGIGGQAFTANTKHVLILRRRTDADGVSHLDVSIDGAAWKTSVIVADTFTQTGTNTTTLGAGWANSGGAYWQFLTGRIYRVTWVAGVAKSDSDCAGIVTRLATDHAVTLP